MGEQQNVALIQRLFEAFGRGDIQTIVDNTAADCEIYLPGPQSIPHAGRHTGQDAIRNNYFGVILSTQSNRNVKLERVVAHGDTVVVIANYTARINATGRTLETPLVIIFDLQDGKVKRVLNMSDTAAGAAAYTVTAAAAT